MTEIIMKKVSELKPDKNQPRKEFKKEDMKMFGESMKLTGQINPIEIDENNIIVTGESRWRGAKEVGLKEISCVVLKNLSKEDRLTRQLAENLARKSLSIVEQRESIKELWDMMYPDKPISNNRFIKTGGRGKKGGYSEIARRIGCKQSWITQILQVEYAPKEIKKAVDEGKLSISSAHEIMKLDKEDQKDYAKRVIKKDIEHRTIRKEVEQLKKSPKDVKEAILKEDITIEQAPSISKLKPKQREQAIKEHKAIKLIDKNVEKNIKHIDDARSKREFDKQLIQAKNWILSFRNSVGDSYSQLEKTIKILLISTQFIPMMDEKQKEELDIQLNRFLEIIEKAKRLTNQIEEKIK